MNIYIKTGLPVILFLFIAASTSATTRKVLFIGNSYTYTNNMPLMLQTMATALGDTLIYDESDPGGYTFAMHCTNATTISKIFSQQWDLVVLQEQSQLPAFPPAEVDTEVYPYAHILDSMVHANDTCTQTMFLMTWGHANGDPMNCPSYPIICTYAGMQQRLRASYLQMTQNNHAVVAPVGVAWKVMMDSFPSTWLYISDSSHPVIPGSYLEACVLYSSIFHKKTLGCTYTDGLTTTVTHTLQQVSDRVVFDSLSQWQQYGHYPYAGFKYTTAGNTATFTQASPVPASDYWLFGDGNHDTTSNPVHTYTGPGTYLVAHTVSTDCFKETMTDTLRLGVTATAQIIEETSPIKILQNGNGKITFLFAGSVTHSILEVYDMTGKLIRKYATDGKNIADQFTPGIYLYKAYTPGRTIADKGKLIVY